MAWLAALIGVGGSLAGAGISAATAPSPGGAPGPDEIANLLALESRFAPTSGVAGLNQLSTQASYGAGASPDALALELASRNIEQSKNALFAHRFQQEFQNLQSLILNPSSPLLQNPNVAGGIQFGGANGDFATRLRRLNSMLEHYGGGAQVVFENGQLSFKFADQSINQYLDAARQNGSDIRAQRLSAQANLSRLAADFPTGSASDIDALTRQYQSQIQADIKNNYDTQTQDILQSANTRGYNPAGTLGLLEQQRARETAAAPTTAAERALQILSGRQSTALGSIAGINAALAPDQMIAVLNAIRGQQTPNTGQLAAAQIGAQTSLANTATGARSNAFSNAAGGISDAGVLAALLSRNRAQNSQGPGAPNPNTPNPNSFSDFGGDSLDTG